MLLKIRETWFKLKAKKCKFGYSELQFLGQIVNKNGIKSNPDGHAVIKYFPLQK